MTAYYNEIDSHAAAWLRNLIAEGHIAHGDVDDRSITDVQPSDLKGYTQCHFFAGIGVWSRALRNAGWSDDRPVWTGSCPCPPFSAAGKGQRCPQCGSKSNLCHPGKTGHFICLDCGCDRYADGRHLWPEFSRLIRECRPPVVVGEQVASKDGRLWLDAVSADLENASYGVAGADLCAAGVGSPHIRQRLWFGAVRVADAERPEGARQQQHGGEGLREQETAGFAGSCLAGGLDGTRAGAGVPQGQAVAGGMADADGRDASAERQQPGREHRQQPRDGSPVRGGDRGARPDATAGMERPGPTNGFWRDADWLYCRDGKWRPARSGTCPLADGAPARVVRLRAYGNAIVEPAARAFVEAVMDCLPSG